MYDVMNLFWFFKCLNVIKHTIFIVIKYLIIIIGSHISLILIYNILF